jgi:hypothetical protein
MAAYGLLASQYGRASIASPSQRHPDQPRSFAKPALEEVTADEPYRP